MLNFYLDAFRKQDGLVKRKIGNNVMFLDYNDGGISRTLRKMKDGDPDREPAFMHILREEVKDGMTVLDLGANIGYVTLIMADIVGKKGHVYAIEPDPRNYKILSKNIEVNNISSFVDSYHMGVSNNTGEITFYASDKSNLGGMTRSKHTSKAITVKVTKLDDFLKDKQKPQFMKMDIEGHEVEVLEGLYETVKNSDCPMKILMEVHPMYYSEDHSLDKQLRNYLNVGFKAKYVLSAGVGRPDFFVNNGYEPEKVFDVGGGLERGIFTNISGEHLLSALSGRHLQYIKRVNQSTNKIVRAIMIER